MSMSRWFEMATRVGVPTDVVEHLLRAGKGRFRVDHPLGLSRRLQMRGKGPRIGQPLERAAEAQVAVIEGVLYGAQEEPAEETRQHTDRQEEPRSAGDPAGAVRREPAAGDDAVEMRVVEPAPTIPRV